MNSLIKKPSGWLPIVLTAIILVIMGLYFASAIPPEPTTDEGTMAHTFQIWGALEFFAVVFFAIKWLPHEPREVWKITSLQIVLAIVPVIIVWFVEH